MNSNILSTQDYIDKPRQQLSTRRQGRNVKPIFCPAGHNEPQNMASGVFDMTGARCQCQVP